MISRCMISGLTVSAFLLLCGACQGTSGGSPTTPPSETPASGCPSGEVCVQGVLASPICMASDGMIPTGGADCEPEGSSDPCGDGEVCLVIEHPEGAIGRCVASCRPRDDRPQCVPACFNQVCAGTFDMCSREHGACQPVPCSGDSDCADLIACDYPDRRGPAFHCNIEAGFCERAL